MTDDAAPACQLCLEKEADIIFRQTYEGVSPKGKSIVGQMPLQQKVWACLDCLIRAGTLGEENFEGIGDDDAKVLS